MKNEFETSIWTIDDLILHKSFYILRLSAIHFKIYYVPLGVRMINDNENKQIFLSDYILNVLFSFKKGI